MPVLQLDPRAMALSTLGRSPDALREEEGERVRDFVREHLLLGKMCLELAPSDHAWGSMNAALRIVRLAAEAIERTDLVRVLDGAAGPLRNILKRRAAGDMRASPTDLATLTAATTRVLQELDDLPARELVLGYRIDEVHRKSAQYAGAVASSRALRRKAERWEKRKGRTG